MYNLLTLQLLYEGYTAEKYPDFVRVSNSRFGKNPLKNLDGGFEFTRDHLEKMVFKTPCGKLVKGTDCFRNMSFHLTWQPENFNPVIRCPYAVGKGFECDMVHPLLKENRAHEGSMSVMQFCSCSLTEESYDYENSIEKAYDDKRRHQEELYEEFVQSKKGHVCRHHARYDEHNDQWKMNYSPEYCASICTHSFCPVRGRELNKKKANVYYDIYRKTVKDTGLVCLENESMEMGLRYFDHSVSRDICEAFVKHGGAREIESKYRLEHGRDFVFDPNYTVEIRNVRVESRASRDLMADLELLKSGCKVTWAPEEEKLNKEAKRQRRKIAAEKRIARLEKKIIKEGMDNLNEGDTYRMNKLLSEERIMELEILHQEEKNKPVMVQIGLIDFM